MPSWIKNLITAVCLYRDCGLRFTFLLIVLWKLIHSDVKGADFLRSGSCRSRFFEIRIFDCRSEAPTEFFIFFLELQGTVTSNCRNLFNLFRFLTVLSEAVMQDVQIFGYNLYGYRILYGFLRKQEVLVVLQFGYAGKTCSEVMFNTMFEMLLENIVETKKLLLYNSRFRQIADGADQFYHYQISDWIIVSGWK